MTHPALPRPYRLSDFDYTLPPERIAQQPLARRSAARLLDGSAWPAVDRWVDDLPDLLAPGDLLVFNDTRVMHARLYGHKPSGGAVELLVERVLPDGTVAAHLRASKKPAVGAVFALQPGADAGGQPQAQVLGRWPDARGAMFHLHLTDAQAPTLDAYDLMQRHGHVPLPPYITHADMPADAQRYQTVFARHLGAVAAPTAALHFDEPLLQRLRVRGVDSASVTLHVGAGTFQPVKTDDLAAHVMHAEWVCVPQATQQAVRACRARGGRVVAVGTTSVRALESWAQTGGLDQPKAADFVADTRLFITPGYAFAAVDALLTNFHLPKSTLLMLISAFAGYAHVRRLYDHALHGGAYRFFSYGDAMWLHRAPQQPALKPTDAFATRPAKPSGVQGG